MVFTSLEILGNLYFIIRHVDNKGFLIFDEINKNDRSNYIEYRI